MDNVEKMAKRIQALLATAESYAKEGNEAARDTYLAKAQALQFQYAITDTMLPGEEKRAAEKITYSDFCKESNTPLIKVKRTLIAGLAELNRGKAVMMSEFQLNGKGQPKLNRRAKVRVYAHESDLRFIEFMYTSLLTQMQTAMAAEEAGEPGRKFTNAWRVSFGFGYVNRVYSRLVEAKARMEREAEVATPGTALVIRDKAEMVLGFVQDELGNLRSTNIRRDDHDQDGRYRGHVAGGRADLGGTKVGANQRPELR